jgi:hypothetical protein
LLAKMLRRQSSQVQVLSTVHQSGRLELACPTFLAENPRHYQTFLLCIPKRMQKREAAERMIQPRCHQRHQCRMEANAELTPRRWNINYHLLRYLRDQHTSPLLHRLCSLQAHQAHPDSYHPAVPTRAGTHGQRSRHKPANIPLLLARPDSVQREGTRHLPQMHQLSKNLFSATQPSFATFVPRW